MKPSLGLLFAFLVAIALPAWAEPIGLSGQSNQAVPGPEKSAMQSCPLPGQPITLAQVSQADCCKGHKGVCGCRAGKIVCCDGSVSAVPNCTCHADSGMEN